MTAQRIGILHPGEMGSAVAATVRNSGHEVCWVSEGRSHLTRARAESAGLHRRGHASASLRHLSSNSERLPAGVRGRSGCAGDLPQLPRTYLDANAISPRAQKADRRPHAGERRPLRRRRDHRGWAPKACGQTWLYLSGEDAETVAGCFRGRTPGSRGDRDRGRQGVWRAQDVLRRAGTRDRSPC